MVSEFFAWARSHYDRVIIDAPPYGVVGDVVSLSMLVDGTLIMCCPDRTHFKPIQYCSRSLAEAGANILGVVVNDVDVSNSTAFATSGHRGYGYGYGYSYGPSKSRKGDGEKLVAPEDRDETVPDGAPGAEVDGDDFTDDD